MNLENSSFEMSVKSKDKELAQVTWQGNIIPKNLAIRITNVEQLLDNWHHFNGSLGAAYG